MAAVTKLKPGTRVRLKIQFQTALGNLYEAGMVGTISKFRPYRHFLTNEWMFWIWFDTGQGKQGGLIPASHLVRRKDRG